jgi:hypothetical protein
VNIAIIRGSERWNLMRRFASANCTNGKGQGAEAGNFPNFSIRPLSLFGS